MRVLISYRVDNIHIQIVLSTDPETKNYPLGENVTLVIWAEWPINRMKEPIIVFSILDIYSCLCFS